MTFCADKDPEYNECPIFNYQSIKQDMKHLLASEYNEQQIYQLLEGNARKLFAIINKNIKEDNYGNKRR